MNDLIPTLPGTELPARSHQAQTSSNGIYCKNEKTFSSLQGKYSPSTGRLISTKNTQVPSIGDRVICQILRTSSRQANAQILSTELHCFYPATYKGIIRQQDIKSIDREKTQVHQSFRPGDIVIAVILGVGEGNQGFLLSTAQDNLGVIVAKSLHSAAIMTPISWDTMQCPVTQALEPRKCAKIER
jgi:exosome complex component CSL4